MYDKNGQVVTTAVTNMDIHDICRAGRTYGVRGFFVVTPVKPLQKLALKIIDHWETGYAADTTRRAKKRLARADLRRSRRRDHRYRAGNRRQADFDCHLGTARGKAHLFRGA